MRRSGCWRWSSRRWRAGPTRIDPSRRGCVDGAAAPGARFTARGTAGDRQRVGAARPSAGGAFARAGRGAAGCGTRACGGRAIRRVRLSVANDAVAAAERVARDPARSADVGEALLLLAQVQGMAGNADAASADAQRAARALAGTASARTTRGRARRWPSSRAREGRFAGAATTRRCRLCSIVRFLPARTVQGAPSIDCQGVAMRMTRVMTSVAACVLLVFAGCDSGHDADVPPHARSFMSAQAFAEEGTAQMFMPAPRTAPAPESAAPDVAPQNLAVLPEDLALFPDETTSPAACLPRATPARRTGPASDRTSSVNLSFTGRRAGPPQARPDPLGGSIAVLGERGAVIPTGRRAGPPQARPDPLGGSIAVLGKRGAVIPTGRRAGPPQARPGPRPRRARPVRPVRQSAGTVGAAGLSPLGGSIAVLGERGAP